MINFKVTKLEAILIHAIAIKACAQFNFSLMEIEMDITACHKNGNPLKLHDLYNADKFNFSHDVLGIHKYIDRKTGMLTDCFVPRFSL